MSDNSIVGATDGMLTVGLYSLARVVGNLVFVAGHTALDDDGKVVYPGDPEAQMRFTLDAMNDTLSTYGLTLNDLINVRWYLTDVRYREKILKIRHEYFKPPYPTATLLGVNALALEGLTVEVDGIAVLPDGG